MTFPSDNTEFQALVSSQIELLSEETTSDAAFKRLMLTHILHASQRGAIIQEKLASLEIHDKRQDEELQVLRTTLIEFKNGQIKNLEERLSKVERKLLIAYGIIITVFALPNVPTIFNFIAAGAASTK